MSGALDQAFSSVSNGVIVFAVAVAASPDEFGQITILMTLLFVVLAALRGGLGILLLQMANQPAEDIRRHGSIALFWGLAVAPVLTVTMLAFIPMLGFAAVALAVLTPFVLAQDVLRYIAMTIGRPHIAAVWDGIWCVGAFIALGCAWLRLPFVSVGSVLAWWGLLGFVAFVAMTVSLRVLPRRRGAMAWVRTDWDHRVRYAIDAALEQTSLLVVFVLMSALMGAASTGALRGAMALFAPIGIIGAAVQIVLIPESARSSASPRQIWRTLTPITIYTALFTAAIGAAFYFVPPNIGFYLLGESWVAAHAVLIPTTTWFTAACLSVVQALFLRTLNLSREALTMKITLTITQLLAAVIGAAVFGSTTAVAIALTTQTVVVAIFYLIVWPPWRQEKPADDEPEVTVEDPVSPAELPFVVDVHADTPPPLSVAALRSGVCAPEGPWRAVEVVEETGSTNADLLARARAGENIDGVVLIAEHQTAGRGRLGRQWVGTPRAQLTLSVGVDAATVPTDRWGWLPLATGIAVVDAVDAQTGVHAQVKWPNDVLVDGAKLAGILAEVASPKAVIVVGIGLNVTWDRKAADQPHATSLRDLGVASPDRDALARRLLVELGARIAQWRAGADALASDYREHSATLGSQVKVVLPGGDDMLGTAVEVDEQGRLLVDTNGGREAVSAGDIVHLRPVAGSSG